MLWPCIFLTLFTCFFGPTTPLTLSLNPSLSQIPSQNLTGQAIDTGPLKNYAAFPVRADRVQQVYQTIKFFADGGSVQIQPSSNRPEFNYVLYWEFNITANAAITLKRRLGTDATLVETKRAAVLSDNQQNSSAAFVNGTAETPLLKSFVFQYNAPEDLKVVSWPRTKTLAKLKSYMFNNDFSATPMTYIIDIGLDLNSQDFQLGVRRWYFSPIVTARGKDTRTDDYADSHGSCVASKAVGLKSGVYKSSNLVVIKIDESLPVREIDWAFDTVLADMRANDDAKIAVVACSINSEIDPDPEEWGPIQSTMGRIFNQGGSIVVSSGNYGKDRPDVDTLPAGWADAVFPLIVAGSVNNEDVLSDFSQGPSHVTAWAPGEDVQCANRGGFRQATGTSFSTGMVAGLAAYGLALEEIPFVPDVRTPRGVKAWLRGTARWPRQPGGPPVIWNTLQGV